MSPSGRVTAKKPQRRFQFIDNNNLASGGENSTQVRRHVMQEYMREKRWESRTQAEGEVLEFSTQHYVKPQSQRKLHQSHVEGSPNTLPNPKDRIFANSQAGTGTVIGYSSPPTHPVTALPESYNVQPPNPYVRPLLQIHHDVVEEIPRTFAPATKLNIKRPVQGLYLTPQSFASIADIGDLPPLTPSSSTTGDVPSVVSLSPPFFSSHDHRISCSPEPLSCLSAARTDPFNCLPITLNKQDQELFDFYATVMPACSYGFERRHPQAHNWYISVFIPEAMKSAVAFQNTILVHAANTQAWVRNLPETPLSIEHRARASEMLSNHFRFHPYDISDAAISSTLSAAALEDFDPRPERRKYAWLHWNAAMKKIRDRGGPTALEQNKSLRMLINWSDYIFSGYNGHGSTFFFDHVSSPQHASNAEAENIARNELAQQCEEFIVFLKCAESLALVAANMANNPAVRRKQPIRYSVFEPRQPLYNLLASSNGPRYTKTGQLKQIISRLAALMSINVAIWEYRYSTTASEEFFAELVQNIKYNDLDQHISVEALLQILLSGSRHQNLPHTERPWLVGRLLKVAKRLSRSSWERLNDFLLQCLTLDTPLKPIMEIWEHELRMEILNAPLVSYVLPLMQA